MHTPCCGHIATLETFEFLCGRDIFIQSGFYLHKASRSITASTRLVTLCIDPCKTLDVKHSTVSLLGLLNVIIMDANTITQSHEFFHRNQPSLESEAGFVLCAAKFSLLNPVIYIKITCQPTEVLQSCYFKSVSMTSLF